MRCWQRRKVNHKRKNIYFFKYGVYWTMCKMTHYHSVHCTIEVWSSFYSEIDIYSKWTSVAGFPPRRPGFDPRSGHVGVVVDKVVLGQNFSKYFGFPCQSLFHQLLHNHHRSSGAGTVGQKWPTYQVDSVSLQPEKLKRNKWTSSQLRMKNLN
jgi:hypothetical protein